MTNQLIYPDIPRELLAYLVDLAGKASDMSPRNLWEPVAPTKLQAQELVEASITTDASEHAPLSSEFEKAAQVILAPKVSLTFRAWGDPYSAVESSLLFPGQIRDGGGIILNQINTAYRIGAFIDAADVAAQLAPLIPPASNGSDPFPLEMHIPLTMAAALVAMLDLCRCPEFPEGPYAAQSVAGYIHGQWGMAGFDKLLCALPGLGVSASAPTLTEVEMALSGLANMAYLEEPVEGYYDLGVELLPLVGLTRGEMPGLQWQRVEYADELMIANRTWLLGRDGLIIMLAPMSGNSVLIRSVSSESMTDFLATELAGPRMKSTSVLSSANVNPCSKCGTKILEGTNFCTSCGAPAPEPVQAKFCTDCGTPLQKGIKFCTNCGKKQAE